MSVAEGEYVVLMPVEDPERRFFARAAKGERIKYRKKHFAVGAIAGCEYGTLFELKGRSLQPIAKDAPEINVQTMAANISSSNSATSVDGSSGSAGGFATTADIRRSVEQAAAAVHAAGGGTNNDNRDLVDDNTAQALGQEDVQRMKDAGASAVEIVSSLVANSATYQSKTEYAKAKYIKKKQRQYAPTFRVLPACAQTIVDTMHYKDPKRICGLRSDAVAQLLAYGNIRANCKIIVVDGAKGLLVGSVAERIAGEGRLINLILGPHPNVPLLKYFNLGDRAKTPEKVGHFPFNMVKLLVASRERQAVMANGDVVGEKRKRTSDSDNGEQQIGTSIDGAEDFGFEEWQQTRHLLSITQTKTALGKEGADAFVSVTGGVFHALHVIQAAIPLLAPSACFALFCPYIEPLKEAALWLKKTGSAVHIDLTQLWVRKFQVMPGRTRPDMNMDDGTGYILKGIKCVPE